MDRTTHKYYSIMTTISQTCTVWHSFMKMYDAPIHTKPLSSLLAWTFLVWGFGREEVGDKVTTTDTTRQLNYSTSTSNDYWEKLQHKWHNYYYYIICQTALICLHTSVENVHCLGHFLLCWWLPTMSHTIIAQSILYVQGRCNHGYKWRYVCALW